MPKNAPLSTPPAGSLSAARRPYAPPTREELVERVREADEKCRLLHAEFLKAHDAMREASAQVAFLDRAYRKASEDEAEARHNLKRAIEQEAWESARG